MVPVVIQKMRVVVMMAMAMTEEKMVVIEVEVNLLVEEIVGLGS